MTDEKQDSCEAAWREHTGGRTAIGGMLSADAFRAGYAAATERAAVTADGFQMVKPVTIEHEDINDTCKHIAAAIRGQS